MKPLLTAAALLCLPVSHGSANQAAQIPGFLPGTYVCKGDWRLIRFCADNDAGRDRFELYNLKADNW